MINTDIEIFFEHLAERKYHENDLSDITYALCYANDEFKKFFLNYFFNAEIDTKDLTREYTKGNSRPDFFFHDLQGNEKLIEVKIFDGDIHPEYKKVFDKATRAFIANYSLNKKGKDAVWHIIKTWTDFYNELDKNPKLKNDSFVLGYKKYLKEIIGIMEFKQINSLKILNLPVFYDDMEKIASNLEILKYTSSKSLDSHYYGRYFHVKHEKNEIFFWFGVDLSNNSIYISFFNNKHWVPAGILKTIKNLSCLERKDDNEFGNYWFKLGQEEYDKLCAKNTNKDAQEKILENFIRRVFGLIGAEKFLPAVEN